MIELGQVTLTTTNLYIAILWMVAGLLCSLLTDRGGTWVAGITAFVVRVLPVIVLVNNPIRDTPILEFFPFGAEVDRYFDDALIPLFAAIIGALVGELIMPSEYEE